jgi:hypothetical protein
MDHSRYAPTHCGQFNTVQQQQQQQPQLVAGHAGLLHVLCTVQFVVVAAGLVVYANGGS